MRLEITSAGRHDLTRSNLAYDVRRLARPCILAQFLLMAPLYDALWLGANGIWPAMAIGWGVQAALKGCR